MESFTYHNPGKIIFGVGERFKLAKELSGRGYKRVLLVCGKGPFRENGLYDELRESIEEEEIRVYSMNDIDSNPRISSVREGTEICKTKNIECIIALGGGSTMDCSKVIAAAALSEDDPWEYLWGHRKTFEQSLDTVMIPTIAATGTEINPFAVIMDDQTVSKTYCAADCLFPNLTIMDPEITISVPLKLTVWGAMDILSHTFEFYFNGYGRSIFQNRLSEAIIHSVIECINNLRKNPSDLTARGELMWSSIMAWGGLTKIGRGEPDMACHTIAEGVVPYYDIHHGAALGVITPRWMRFVVERTPDFFARFAEKIYGVHTSDAGSYFNKAKNGIEKYISWLKEIDAPRTLQELTGTQIQDQKLKEISGRIYRDAGGKIGIFTELTESDVYEILRASTEPL